MIRMLVLLSACFAVSVALASCDEPECDPEIEECDEDNGGENDERKVCELLKKCTPNDFDAEFDSVTECARYFESFDDRSEETGDTYCYQDCADETTCAGFSGCIDSCAWY